MKTHYTDPSLINWPVFKNDYGRRPYDEVEGLKKDIGRNLAKLKHGDITLPSAASLISSAVDKIIELTEKRVKNEEFLKKLKPMH